MKYLPMIILNVFATFVNFAIYFATGTDFSLFCAGISVGITIILFTLSTK